LLISIPELYVPKKKAKRKKKGAVEAASAPPARLGRPPFFSRAKQAEILTTANLQRFRDNKDKDNARKLQGALNIKIAGDLVNKHGWDVSLYATDAPPGPGSENLNADKRHGVLARLREVSPGTLTPRTLADAPP
jgi:hypothetical protein